MDLFRSNHKLFDLVDANPNLLPVINRFGIRPGFKDKTVAEVCTEKNINKDFFLALVNTYNNPDYFPEEELLGFSPVLIVDYLKRTHAYYLEYCLPRLESLLERLISGGRNSDRELTMIRSFYEKYKHEFLLHMKDEEENVFPVVLKMVKGDRIDNHPPASLSFEKDHINMEDKLNDLKNLLIKYLAPDYNDNDFNEFLASLFQFEKDITDHSRIEDHILVPQIAGIQRGRK